jgi:hypothetical protein
LILWWTMQDLNLRPPACEAGALPTELIVRAWNPNDLGATRQPPRAPTCLNTVRASGWATLVPGVGAAGRARPPVTRPARGYGQSSMLAVNSTLPLLLWYVGAAQ